MAGLTLVIGNKRYSSWSLRPWLALKVFRIPFKEMLVRIREPDSAANILRYSPAGRVPVLIDGRMRVWESLAVLEYLAEKFPSQPWWPKDPKARALARSISHEMHAGFTALRTHCPMNCGRTPQSAALPAAALQDAERIQDLWQDARRRFGRGGNFLFGRFSIADAMYAPVAIRFGSYQVPMTSEARRYVKALDALPDFQSWLKAGSMEKPIPEFEK